jgi:hypothetical protein
MRFGFALVEFMVADGSKLQTHHRQRFDRRFVMEQRR